MKIAILSVATNNYKSLLSDLIKSVDSLFLKNYTKEYFIFSDSDEYISNNKINFTKIQHEDWPYITLNRFKYFFTVIDRLKEFDAVIYLDCDLLINKEVTEIPQTPYFCVCHPSNAIHPDFWPTEKNINSTAYCPERKDLPYVQGCLWGGSSDAIIGLINTLYQNTETDLKNGIIASWHDESHLNKYMSTIDRCNITVLNPGYAYPERWIINFDKIIIHRDKNYEEFPRFEGKK